MLFCNCLFSFLSVWLLCNCFVFVSDCLKMLCNCLFSFPKLLCKFRKKLINIKKKSNKTHNIKICVVVFWRSWTLLFFEVAPPCGPSRIVARLNWLYVHSLQSRAARILKKAWVGFRSTRRISERSSHPRKHRSPFARRFFVVSLHFFEIWRLSQRNGQTATSCFQNKNNEKSDRCQSRNHRFRSVGCLTFHGKLLLYRNVCSASWLLTTANHQFECKWRSKTNRSPFAPCSLVCISDTACWSFFCSIPGRIKPQIIKSAHLERFSGRNCPFRIRARHNGIPKTRKWFLQWMLQERTFFFWVLSTSSSIWQAESLQNRNYTNDRNSKIFQPR